MREEGTEESIGNGQWPENQEPGVKSQGRLPPASGGSTPKGGGGQLTLRAGLDPGLKKSSGRTLSAHFVRFAAPSASLRFGTSPAEDGRGGRLSSNRVSSTM